MYKGLEVLWDSIVSRPISFTILVCVRLDRYENLNLGTLASVQRANMGRMEVVYRAFLHMRVTCFVPFSVVFRVYSF